MNVLDSDFIDFAESNIWTFLLYKAFLQTNLHGVCGNIFQNSLNDFLRGRLEKGCAKCQAYILDWRIPFGFAGAVGCIPIVTDSPD